MRALAAAGCGCDFLSDPDPACGTCILDLTSPTLPLHLHAVCASSSAWPLMTKSFENLDMHLTYAEDAELESEARFSTLHSFASFCITTAS